jgi:hypothetical protein
MIYRVLAAALLSSLIVIGPAFAQPDPEGEDELGAPSEPEPDGDAFGESPGASSGQIAGLEGPDAGPGAARARERTLTFNPLAILFGVFNAEYEQALGPNMSMFVGPSLIYLSALDTSVLGLGLTGGLRYFVGSGRAPKGFWVGPQVGLSYVSLTANDTTVAGAAIGVGGLLGYTWLFNSGFVVSLGGGVQFTYATATADDTTVDLTGVGPALRASIGWGF